MKSLMASLTSHPLEDIHIDLDNRAKYKGELYALIVGLTTGEAKCVVRGITEKGLESDGFLALASLQARFDANTAASLLQRVMEAVNPPTLNIPSVTLTRGCFAFSSLSNCAWQLRLLS